MRLTVAEARSLAERTMRAIGHSAEEAAIIADHLIDCELRGLSFGGLPRALSISERFAKAARPRQPIRVVRETHVSALVEGGDNVGYLVGHRAMTLAVEKAKSQGLAAIGANDTWYTGMLSYYAEMGTREGLVSVIASNATPWVAPHGGTQGRFGTNPICIGFPSDSDPIIWDIGTSVIMHGQALLAQRLGEPIPPDAAFAPDGTPTRDPTQALAGALAVWGGHKGSGLAVAVQLLGAMCSAPALPQGIGEFGCLFIVLNPQLFGAADAFKYQVSEYAAAVRSARPVAGGPAVRMPFDRSAAERRRRAAEDAIEVADAIHARLLAIAQGNSG